jgi:ZIP family zinc transporter
VELLRTLGFALGASLPLLVGAAVGVVWRPPRRLIAVALAFAAGALIAAVSFELLEESYHGGGALRAGLSFAAGAVVFVVADAVLDRITAGSPTGFALLAAVTLDGVPENTALGVSLNAALLLAVFVSNFPEALAGAVTMREQGRSRRRVLALWAGATVLLAAAVLAGRYAFAGAAPDQLALPLAFAGGAVLASVIDTLAPEAFGSGGPFVALASAGGFFTAFMLSA